MEYPVRDVTAFRSPPMMFRRPSDLYIFCLNVSIHASLKVRPSRCCLMDVNSANTLSLMRHPSHIKPQNASMKKRCSSAFFCPFLCQSTTSALGRNTRWCRKVTTLTCALPSLYPSLGMWSPSVSATKSISLPAAM